MTEDDFDKLGAHLDEVAPIVQAFCEKHGFERITGSSIGRYPRIRLQSGESPTRWLDLWMGLDEEGQRLKIFSPEIPYELSAGAFFDVEENRKMVRYQRSIVIWPSLPFRQVVEELSGALEEAAIEISSWDLQLIRREGRRVELG